MHFGASATVVLQLLCTSLWCFICACWQYCSQHCSCSFIIGVERGTSQFPWSCMAFDICSWNHQWTWESKVSCRLECKYLNYSDVIFVAAVLCWVVYNGYCNFYGHCVDRCNMCCEFLQLQSHIPVAVLQRFDEAKFRQCPESLARRNSDESATGTDNLCCCLWDPLQVLTCYVVLKF